MLWCDERPMDADLEQTLFSLLEWQDRQQRRESLQEAARGEFAAELARLMERLAVREQDGDGSNHG